MSTNSELRRTILYADSDAQKQEAWQQLMKQNPSNVDLYYIIRYTELKQEAAKVLRERYGVFKAPDELGLIKAIARIVLEQPKRLRMESWHCGTTHCIGGWACILDEDTAKIEAASHAETAALAMLPSFSHLFYVDKDTALNELKRITETA